MTMSKLPAAEQLQRPGFNFQSHRCKPASLIAPKAILSALDIGLKNSTKRRRGVTPGEYLHLFLRLAQRGRISTLTLGSISTCCAHLTCPPKLPQLRTEAEREPAPIVRTLN